VACFLAVTFSNVFIAPVAAAPDQQIWIEAESGTLRAPMVAAQDAAASESTYVWVPTDTGYGSSSTSKGTATYTFTVTKSGDYTLWGRAIYPGWAHNSFWVNIDKGTPTWWDLTNPGYSSSWQWAKERTYHLSPGTHTLVIKWREDGTKIDKLVLSSDASFKPTGLGEQENVDVVPQPTTVVPIPTQSTTPIPTQIPSGSDGGDVAEPTPAPTTAPGSIVGLFIEAESGELAMPMMQGDDAAASGGAFAYVPDGYGYRDASSKQGIAQYTFTVPVEGDYTIWGKAIAPDGNSDSFWVTVDSGTPIWWDIGNDGYTTTWRWGTVSTVHLAAGQHTLALKWREAGAEVDRFYISNVYGASPAGAGETAATEMVQPVTTTTTPVSQVTPVTTVTPRVTTTATPRPTTTVTPVATTTPRPTTTMPVSSDTTYGAGSNPTGNPIGGGTGYSEIITSGTYTVRTLSELKTALGKAKSGETIFIPGDVTIDVTGVWNSLKIPAGVTLASDRGNGASQGGMLSMATNLNLNPPYSDRYGRLLETAGSNVRVTGLRIKGPFVPADGKTIPGGNEVNGVWFAHANGEVDNCEIWGFNGGGVEVYGASDITIHHNYIHHCIEDGDGYGVAIYGPGWGDNLGTPTNILVEANHFYNCRHAISGDGSRGESYEARYNYVDGVWPAIYGQVFDMHAEPYSSGSAAPAGGLIKIHHNTVMVVNSGGTRNQFSVDIQGVPTQGAYIEYNWFYAGTTYSSISGTPSIVIENNNNAKNIIAKNNAIGSDKKVFSITPMMILT
jgi:hypothetical protein